MQYKKIAFKALQFVLATGALMSQTMAMEDQENLSSPQKQEVSLFTQLPKPIIHKIFENLSPLDFRTLPQVSQKFKNYIYEGINDCLSGIFKMEPTENFDSRKCYPYAKSNFNKELEGSSYLYKRLTSAEKTTQNLAHNLLSFCEKTTTLFKKKIFLSCLLELTYIIDGHKREQDQLTTRLRMKNFIPGVVYPNAVALFINKSSIMDTVNIFEYIQTWKNLSFLKIDCQDELKDPFFHDFIDAVENSNSLRILSLQGDDEGYFGDFVSKIMNYKKEIILKKIILKTNTFTKKMMECLKKDLQSNKNITSLVMIENHLPLFTENNKSHTENISGIQEHIQKRFSILEGCNNSALTSISFSLKLTTPFNIIKQHMSLEMFQNKYFLFKKVGSLHIIKRDQLNEITFRFILN